MVARREQVWRVFPAEVAFRIAISSQPLLSGQTALFVAAFILWSSCRGSLLLLSIASSASHSLGRVGWCWSGTWLGSSRSWLGLGSVYGSSAYKQSDVSQHLSPMSLTCWSCSRLAGGGSGRRISGCGFWLLCRGSTGSTGSLCVGVGGAGRLLALEDALESVHGVQCCSINDSEKDSCNVWNSRNMSK